MPGTVERYTLLCIPGYGGRGVHPVVYPGMVGEVYTPVYASPTMVEGVHPCIYASLYTLCRCTRSQPVYMLLAVVPVPCVLLLVFYTFSLGVEERSLCAEGREVLSPQE